MWPVHSRPKAAPRGCNSDKTVGHIKMRAKRPLRLAVAFLLGNRLTVFYSVANTLRAAFRVNSMSSSEIAALVKPASKADGAR